MYNDDTDMKGGPGSGRKYQGGSRPEKDHFGRTEAQRVDEGVAAYQRLRKFGLSHNEALDKVESRMPGSTFRTIKEKVSK